MDIENRRMLFALILVHVLVALAAGVLPVLARVDDLWDDIPAGIVAFSQMSLLALWLSFGRTQLLLKSGVVLLAGLCLTALVLFAAHGGWPSLGDDVWLVLGCVFAPVPCITIPAAIFRRRGVEVQQRSPGVLPATAGRLQFSLARVLLWTSVFSVLLAVGRILAGIQYEFGIAFIIVFASLLGFVCGSVALASLWASLAEGLPLLRILMVMALAPTVGALAAYAMSGAQSTLAWVFLAMSATLQAIIVISTLLVLRAAGYRITSRGAMPRDNGVGKAAESTC